MQIHPRIKRFLNGKRVTIETPVKNIFFPITPKSLFLHGNATMILTDNKNNTTPIEENFQKDPQLYDSFKLFLSKFFTEKEIADGIKTPKKIHEQNFKLIEINKKLILRWANKLDSDPIGFSFDRIHSIQFNYFKNQFLDCYLSGQFWAAGIALLEAIEIQIRVLLIQSEVPEKKSLSTQDIGSLISLLKKNLNTGLIKVNDKKDFLEALNIFDNSRNRIFAHCFPDELLKRIDNESRKTHILFGSVNKEPKDDLSSTKNNLISSVAQIESSPVINTFYYKQLDEILDAYCTYHSNLKQHYKTIFYKDPKFNYNKLKNS